MSLELYLAYVLAVGVLLIIPGPTVLLVVGHSLAHGRRLAARSVLGVISGDLAAMSVSLAGLGALLMASSQVFTVMKWIGAIYLVYLGIQRWRDASGHEDEIPPSKAGGRSLYAQAFAVTALNPKGIIFFVAFLPQFIDCHGAVLPQLLLLGATFLVMAGANASMYVLLADRLRVGLRNARRRRIFNRLGGTALIGAGILTATLEHR